MDVSEDRLLELVERLADVHGVTARLGAVQPLLLLLTETVLADLELDAKDAGAAVRLGLEDEEVGHTTLDATALERRERASASRVDADRGRDEKEAFLLHPLDALGLEVRLRLLVALALVRSA